MLFAGLMACLLGTLAFVTRDFGPPWWPHAISGNQARVFGLACVAWGIYVLVGSIRKMLKQ